MTKTSENEETNPIKGNNNKKVEGLDRLEGLEMLELGDNRIRVSHIPTLGSPTDHKSPNRLQCFAGNRKRPETYKSQESLARQEQTHQDTGMPNAHVPFLDPAETFLVDISCAEPRGNGISQDLESSEQPNHRN